MELAPPWKAENVLAWRQQRAFARHVLQARLVIGATAGTSVALLLVLAL